MAKEAMVELRGAARTYGSDSTVVRALLPTSLSLTCGEFACIAGPSGSGKTTLLNLAGLLDLPTEGAVLLGGVDTGRLSKSARAEVRREKVGFVFQSHNLLPILTAMENVEYALLVRGIGVGERRRFRV